MSVLGGIWNFDGRPVDREWLAKLSMEMARHGPDGEYFYIDGPIGIVYRPFHTTGESRLEQQPWISPKAIVSAWAAGVAILETFACSRNSPRPWPAEQRVARLES